MKRILALLLVLLMAGTMIACEHEPAENGTETPDGSESVSEAYGGPDYYVSTTGDDNADGSVEHPFASFGRAREAVRALRAADPDTAVTVTFAEGRYPVNAVVLSQEDSGAEGAPVTYRGNGQVIFDAGRTIPADRFSPVTDETVRARFDPSAADRILVCDLADNGITAEDLGTMLAIGTYAGSAALPKELCGSNPSVFSGDTRLTLARYPNDADDLTVIDEITVGEDDILDEGVPGGEGGLIRLPAEAAERAAGWADVDDIWAFGYFMFDWADVSTPLDYFDPETGAIKLRYYTYSGYRAGGTYYLYNIPEELDAPGEYWIDYDNLKLYYYPDGEAGDVMITLDKNTQIGGDVSYVTFDGITFTGCGGSVIILNGDNISVTNCTIKDADGTGIRLNGYNEYVFNCEICHIGKDGIRVDNGDKLTLTPGNSWIDNCYIHHYAEIYKTYQDGAWISGVGGKITHCEICDAPHSAICATGNDTLLEFNYVHDVVQKCSDGGAFYAGGRTWSAGNVIRYNLFENIGNSDYRGTAIYFDDGLCGYSAYGNVIINATGGGFLCGGGRDIQVTNNLIIGNEETGAGTAIAYDERMITWYHMEDHPNVYDPEQNGWWKALCELPLNEGIWLEKYPQLASVHFDTDNIEDPDFLCNPTHSVIKNNIWIGPVKRWTFAIEPAIYEYSEVGYNYTHTDVDRVFEPGTYELSKIALRDKDLEWEPIPYGQFGRYEVN